MKPARSAQMRLTKRAREQLILEQLRLRYDWPRLLGLREQYSEDWNADTEIGRFIRARYAQAEADRRRMEALADDSLMTEAQHTRERLRSVAAEVAASQAADLEKAEARTKAAQAAAIKSGSKRGSRRQDQERILRDEVRRMLSDTTRARYSAARIAKIIHAKQADLGLAADSKGSPYSERSILNKVRRFLAEKRG